MSSQLRSRCLIVGRWVRCSRIFSYNTHRQMVYVHLFFVKLFGCMLTEARLNGHEIPIDVALFSEAILNNRPHPDVHLQFAKYDGLIGRSDLHCWKSEQGDVLATWLYQLDSFAICVVFAKTSRWEHRHDLWHPNSHTSSKRFLIADFMHAGRFAD